MDFIAGANYYILNDATAYFICTALELCTQSKKKKKAVYVHVYL